MWDVEIQKIFELPARFIDVTLQTVEINNILLKDGVAKDVKSGQVQGVGVRVLNRTWGFASTNNIDDFLAIAEKAYRGSKNGREIKFSAGIAVEDKVLVKPAKDPWEVSFGEKRELLHQAEEELRNYKEVVSSSISYADSKSSILYMNSEGSEIYAEYPRVAFSTYVFAKKDGKIQGASERLGCVGGLEHLEGYLGTADEAARKA
ncbi:MAG: DNA gyrase modulator, partial [Candidatus Hydrothermarchaeota archaeon]|nr:DNA gyrase modulator [Candidatus Hydrothermarchaeota archaeon]